MYLKSVDKTTNARVLGLCVALKFCGSFQSSNGMKQYFTLFGFVCMMLAQLHFQ